MASENIEIFLPLSDKLKFSEIDSIICTHGFEKDEKLSWDPHKELLCSNYRTVIKKDVSNGTDQKVKLKVSTININNETEYMRDIILRCNVIPEDIKSTIISTDRSKFVYYKGAYTIFPSDISSKMQQINQMADNKNINDNKITDLKQDINNFIHNNGKVFERSSRALLLVSLFMLKKMGYEIIIVDPEPGVHPKTIDVPFEERRKGLVKLYKDMGLYEIICPATAYGMIYKSGLGLQDEIKEFDEFHEFNDFDPDLKKQMLDYNMNKMTNELSVLNQKVPVMIGIISDMIKQINPEDMGLVEKVCQNIFLTVNRDQNEKYQQCMDAIKVPIKIDTTLADIPNVVKHDEFMTKYNKLQNYELKQSYIKNKQNYLKLSSHKG